VWFGLTVMVRLLFRGRGTQEGEPPRRVDRVARSRLYPFGSRTAGSSSLRADDRAAGLRRRATPRAFHRAAIRPLGVPYGSSRGKVSAPREVDIGGAPTYCRSCNSPTR